MNPTEFKTRRIRTWLWSALPEGTPRFWWPKSLRPTRDECIAHMVKHATPVMINMASRPLRVHLDESNPTAAPTWRENK